MSDLSIDDEPSKSVLIVEDEKVLRDVYEIILKAEGYNVHSAVNGQEGLAAVSQHQPNLVILDIFMPVMDGREFLKQVDLKKHTNMKVVVCSNTSDTGIRDEMLALGADQIHLKADMAPADLVGLVAPYFS